MNRVAARLPEDVNRVVKDVAARVHREVVLGTPADTGKARTNWIVSRAFPRGDVLAPHAPGRRLGKAERTNAQVSITLAEHVIAGRNPGETVFIQNNADYIGELNRGKSPQAAPGYVNNAVTAAVGMIAAVRIVRVIT